VVATSAASAERSPAWFKRFIVPAGSEVPSANLTLGGVHMIARIWRGVVKACDKDIYLDYLNETGLPEYRTTKGNRGVWVLRRVQGDTAEFTLISLWDSYDAIRAFAGPEYEKAVYYPEDKKYLLELDPHVTHYEVLTAPSQ
jgi:heme-degrading monooxygenase HmoA